LVAGHVKLLLDVWHGQRGMCRMDFRTNVMYYSKVLKEGISLEGLDKE